MADKIETTVAADTKLHVRAFDRMHNGSAEITRLDAVAAALEIVKATCAGQGVNQMRSAMSYLSETADKIQEALNKE
ncbi:MAG: hypothetical protein MPK09_05150 [Gammaproteobacteria bacterium]|nr:hypothetical protein [Gammaproteobacteria bacterium]